MTKVTIDLRTWVAAYVCEPMHVYAGTFLHTQLGFQKYKKCKFSAIIAQVWNKSYIVWEPLQTPFFSLYKALHSTFSKYIAIPWKKPKIH